MYAEFKFIFDPVLGKPNLIDTRTDNTGDIYERLPSNRAIFYKDKAKPGIGEVRNSIKNNVYGNDTDNDPYLDIIDYFSKFPCMTLRPADFAYLTDLGVYPINRLIIMRRYADGIVVPGNLLEWGDKGPEPIATVVGWVKEGADEFFTFSFNEEWRTQTQTIDKVFGEILEKEFGFAKGGAMFAAVPGWSQGFLWGFLAKARLASEAYNWDKTPIGDPNVLKEAMMRDIEGQSLKSDFSITFETSYEQKFISGADPSQAMVDIISNLTTFGTSNMNFYLRPTSKTVEQLIKALNGTNNTGSGNYQDWANFVISLAQAFFQGIKETAKKISGTILGQSPATNTTDNSKKNENADKSNSTNSTDTPKGIPNASKQLETAGAVSDFGNNLVGNPETSEGVLRNNAAAGNIMLNAGKAGASFLNTLIAGTVMKYRWPLKGSLAMMTGLPTTPWHITIGNPYSPILTLNNIVVTNVELSFGTDMGFGDMPNNIKAKISLKLGRPLGKQEIDTAFNNSYRRVYSKPSINDQKTINAVTETSANSKGKPTEQPVKEVKIAAQQAENKTANNTQTSSNNSNSQYTGPMLPPPDAFQPKPSGYGYGRIKP